MIKTAGFRVGKFHDKILSVLNYKCPATDSPCYSLMGNSDKLSLEIVNDLAYTYLSAGIVGSRLVRL